MEHSPRTAPLSQDTLGTIEHGTPPLQSSKSRDKVPRTSWAPALHSDVYIIIPYLNDHAGRACLVTHHVPMIAA